MYKNSHICCFLQKYTKSLAPRYFQGSQAQKLPPGFFALKTYNNTLYGWRSPYALKKVLLSERVFKSSLGEWMKVWIQLPNFHRPSRKLLQGMIRKTMNKRHNNFQIRHKISWNVHIIHCFELKLHTLLMTLVTLCSWDVTYAPGMAAFLFFLPSLCVSISLVRILSATWSEQSL